MLISSSILGGLPAGMLFIRINQIHSMEKIDLNRVRGFSDSITATFNFIKQEFKPLLKSMAVIVLPFVLGDMLLKSYVVREALDFTLYDMEDWDATLSTGLLSMVSYLATGVIYFWMSLFGISYMKVYVAKFGQADASPVAVGEVFGVMGRKLGVALFWYLLYVLMVVAGSLFCLVPGIYLGVVYIFPLYAMILHDRPFSAAMPESSELVKGAWWNVFGYVLVLGLIVSGLSYIFGIPYLVLTIKSIFTEGMPGTYEMTLGIMLSTLGQNLMMVISVLGLGVYYYSAREGKEHQGLLNKIEEIGKN